MIPLEKLEVYKVAMEIGEMAWDMTAKWPFFAKETLGKQLVKAADLMALDIAEGYGRYFYKENKVFCYYSRGAAKETLSAFDKAKRRDLITRAECDKIEKKLSFYFILMATYIKSIARMGE